MGFWRKLMFWRRRRRCRFGDVAANIQKDIEEFVNKLEDREASLATPEEKLKKWTRKSEPEGKLQGSDRQEEEVEATLRGQVEEHGNKLIEKDCNKEKLEASLLEHIQELEKKLQERDAEKEQLETALNGQIKELKKKIMEQDSYRATLVIKLLRRILELEEELRKKDRDSETVEANPHCIVTEV
jgi:DNA repair exonuclease SbcCD ATPase subunit